MELQYNRLAQLRVAYNQTAEREHGDGHSQSDRCACNVCSYYSKDKKKLARQCTCEMKMTTWHSATGSDCSRKSTTAPGPSAHAMTLTRTLPRSFHSRNPVFCLWSNPSGTARTREGFFVDLASLFFFSTARMAPIRSVPCVFGPGEGQGGSSL